LNMPLGNMRRVPRCMSAWLLRTGELLPPFVFGVPEK
jgi:hypothetical protein